MKLKVCARMLPYFFLKRFYALDCQTNPFFIHFKPRKVNCKNHYFPSEVLKLGPIHLYCLSSRTALNLLI